MGWNPINRFPLPRDLDMLLVFLCSKIWGASWMFIRLIRVEFFTIVSITYIALSNNNKTLKPDWYHALLTNIKVTTETRRESIVTKIGFVVWSEEVVFCVFNLTHYVKTVNFKYRISNKPCQCRRIDNWAYETIGDYSPPIEFSTQW